MNDKPKKVTAFLGRTTIRSKTNMT